jgi:hypothetical protein
MEPPWEHTAPRLLPSSGGSVSPPRGEGPSSRGTYQGPRQRQDCPIHTNDSVASVLGEEQLAGDQLGHSGTLPKPCTSCPSATCLPPTPPPCSMVRVHDTRGRARRGPVGRRRCIRPDHRASRGHRGRPGGAGRRGRRRAGLARSARRISNGGRRGAIVALVAGPTGMVIGGLWWPPTRVVPAPATGSSAALRVSPGT